MRNIEITRTVRDGLVTLKLRFKSITQLLEGDDTAPLPDKELTELAEETIAGYVDEYLVKKKLHLVVALPEKDLPLYAGRIIPEVIRSHFSFHTNDIRHDMVISWREGMYSWVIATINASFAFIFLYLLNAHEIDIESFPIEFVVGFIIILNWVTIWDTYEHFVYDYRALYRKKKIYEKLSLIPISVEVTPVSEPVKKPAGT